MVLRGYSTTSEGWKRKCGRDAPRARLLRAEQDARRVPTTFALKKNVLVQNMAYTNGVNGHVDDDGIDYSDIEAKSVASAHSVHRCHV